MLPMAKNNYGFGGVYLRGKTWWVHYPVHGRQIRESAKTDSEAKAKKLLKVRLGEVQGGQITARSFTVEQFLDEVLGYYRRNQKKSIAWAEIVINVHLKPFFKYHKARAVNSDTINAYIDSRLAKGRKNATINRELALLRRAFKLAMKSGKIGRMPHIPELDERNVRTGFFEEKEFGAVLKYLNPALHPLAIFAYNTGCRKGELLKLQWSQVDLENLTVRLEPGSTKNDEGRMIPLCEEVVESLSEAKRQREELWPESPWVFSWAGARIKDFRGSWAAACKAANVTRHFHDLRRTGVRNLRRAGVSENVSMAISGHKTRSVFDRYDIVSGEDLREAAEKLDKYKKAKKEPKE